MKKISIKSLVFWTLASFAIIGCNKDGDLREKIDPDSLRETTVYKLKNSGVTDCKYQVDLLGVVMSAGDNFESGTFAFQDGTEQHDGMIVKSDGDYKFGQLVSIHLDGTVLGKENGLFTLTDPDNTRVSVLSEGAEYVAVPIQPSKMDVSYQSMYVSMEGLQVIEEDLEKTYGEGVRIETAAKDTIMVKVLAKASFAGKEVAQGSGKISGIVGMEGEKYVIMPQVEDDVEFTDPRFIIGDPNHAAIAWAQGTSLTAFVSEVSTNEIEGAVPLQGPANCYIVSEPGVYVFEAKAANGAYPAGIANGTKMYIKVQALGGNTVVAYLSPEDNSVLWTWHIWASKVSLEDMSVTRSAAAADDGKQRSVVMLDRLLGAASNTPGELGSYGLVYQWGRKDPLPGASILGAWSSSGDNEIPNGSDDWTALAFDGTEKTTVNGDIFENFNHKNGSDLGELTQSAQGGAKYATTFIGNSSSSNITGYPSYADAVWSDMANPCPAGWHVPDPMEAQAILGVSASYQSDEYAVHADGTTPGMDTQVKLGSKLKGFDVWFPNNGNRARKNARFLNLGSRSYAWINEISSANGRVMVIQNNGTVTTVNPSGTSNRGNATGVRCVKDNSYEDEEHIKKDNLAAIVWSEGPSLTGFVSEVSTNEIKGAQTLQGNGNCFIVPSTGVYCFDAKNAAGVYPTGIEEGTKIYVKVVANGGNAVVCCVDNIADNHILWTWHIWCAGESESNMSIARSGINMLDRLLGATSTTAGDPKANGLYFQWGRKDAFPGASIIGDYAEDKEVQSEDVLGGVATAINTVNTALVPVWTVSDAVIAASAQAAAAIPTTMLATQTWENTPGGASEFWTAENDPCPAGWHVPTADEAKLVMGVEAETEFSGMDMTNLGSRLDGLANVWFPNNGDRARKNGRLVSLGRRHFSWLNQTNGNNGYYMTVRSSQISPSGTFNRGNATGVRCVK